jgi:signal transduction histidine kinase
VPAVRAIDVVWLIFLAALAAVGLLREPHSPYEWFVLLALGAVQMAETRLAVSTDRGAAALTVAIKLALCYWLVAETGGIESSYYLIFFLPIVSAASLFELGGVLITTAASVALYLSFLLFVDFETNYLAPEGIRELALRVPFFFLIAIVVNRLATENRRKTEHLAAANQELTEAQAEVRRSERLAALGQLSAGLAHEIRNPLGVISASAEVLERNVERENDVAKEMAGYIRSEVNRSNSLVTRFLDFARPSQLDRATHDLNAIVRSAIRQFKESLRAGRPPYDVQEKLADLPPFWFDETLVSGAIVNLLLNGSDAMADGGTLQVTTYRDGSTAIIEIADQGEGIPSDQLESIFNPFFTTKPHGVGLGLAIVSNSIDSHGGTISVTSRPGEGSTFRIQLPMDVQP